MPNPNGNPSRFSERDTEEYYDAEDALYRSFWDAEGSLHWGIFTGQDEPGDGADARAGFLAACSRLNEIMLANSGINETARVLDLGCGNGNTAAWLCRATGAHVTGVDLSGVRIANAIASLAGVPDLAPPAGVSQSFSHRLAFRRRRVHARLEPGHHLPHPGQGQDVAGSVPRFAAGRRDGL